MSRAACRNGMKLYRRGMTQLRRKDYRSTDALQALVESFLDLQPGLKDFLLSIVPPKQDLKEFILDGLRYGYFMCVENEEEFWLVKR